MSNQYFDKRDQGSYDQDKLRTLLEIASGLSEAKNFEQVGKVIFNSLNRFSRGGVPVGIKLGVLDRETDLYTIVTNSLTYIKHDEIETDPEKISYPIKDIKYFSKIVIETKKVLLIEDNHSEYALSIHPAQSGARSHSMLFIPLIYEENIVGLLSFAREPKNSIPPDFVEFFDSIAKYVSIKINDLLKERWEMEREIRIRESERLYRTLIETSPDAIALTSLDMKILLCNQNLAELLGYQDGEMIIGSDAFKYFPIELHDKLKSGMKAIFITKKAFNREYRMIKKNGDIISCEMDVSLIHDKNNNPDGFLALIRDITKKKMEQAELKLNEQRLEGLLELNKKADDSKQEIIDFALNQSIKLTESDIGFVSLVESEFNRMKLVSWSETASRECKTNDMSMLLNMVEGSIWKETIHSKKMQIINNFRNHESFKNLPPGHITIDRVMIIPVIDNEKVVMMAGIANKKSNYDESDSRQATLIMYELWRIIQSRNFIETITETRELFKNLVETVNDWIFEIDTNGNITYSSPRSKDIVGIDEYELIGKSIMDFLPPAEREKIRKTYYEYDIKSRKSIYLENVFPGKESAIIFLESSIIPFFNDKDDLAGFRIIARDISMRKYYERKINKMEKLYQAIVEDQTELIVRLTVDGVITFVNKSFCKFLDNSKEFLIGKNLFKILPHDSGEKLKQKFSELSCDNPFSISKDIERRSNGQLIAIEWILHAIVDEKNTIIEIQSVGRDISKQIEYEEQLAEKNRLIESILQTNPNSLYIYSLSGTGLTFSSKNIYSMLGYKDSDLLEMKSKILESTIHPDDIEAIRKKREKIFSLKDGEIIASEHRVKHKNGGWIWIMSMESVFRRDNNGIPTEVIGSSIDVTERKKIQDEIISYKNDLEKIVSERTNRLMVTNKNLEQEIRERKLTEEKLLKNKIILDAIGDGVFTVDKNCKVTSFNKAAESITGYSIDNAIGGNCHDIFKILEPDTRIEQIIENNTRIIDKSIHIRNRKGDLIPLSLSTYVLYQSGSNAFETAITFRDLSQIEILKKELDEKYTFQDIIAKSPKTRQIFTILPDIAQSDSAVLIEGETGTGKELFAKAIYNLSKRKEMPFITINCAAIPANLLESELFGYMKGSFTDAKQDKKGKVLLADGGTLFLDEIGELPITMQSKLLRLLENFEFEPIGAIKPVKVNIRIIAATNRNLKELVKEQSFRADLYFRMNTVKIVLPPLRERNEDIPYLIEHFIRKFKARFSKRITGVDNEVMKIFYNYSFPGNIRELEKIIEYAFIICEKEKIGVSHIPEEITHTKTIPAAEINSQNNGQSNEQIISIISDYLGKMNITGKKYYSGTMTNDQEKEMIIKTIKKNNGNKSQAARELNMHYTTLWKKLKKYKLL